MKVQAIVAIVVGIACAVLAAPAADSSVLKAFETKETVNILVSFKGADTASVRDSARSLSFADRTQRIQYLHDSLQRHANEVQGGVLDMLSKHRSAQVATVRQLWITNQISIKNADKQLVQELLNREEVSKVAEHVLVPLDKPIDKIEHPVGYNPAAGEQWGVLAIDAPTVWGSGIRGQGVVIAGIDSGVRGTHEALADGFRQEHGWYDAQAETANPVDDYGHGTHTMGTMVGRTNGIGVAPDAQWIACRACTDVCSVADFIQCGQWALCPTDTKFQNPRCDLAPHAVSNSWGSFTSDDDWYDAVLRTWIDANIAPIFSQGNSGPSCSTATSPGDSSLAIGVGSITNLNRLSSFSSVGPTGSGDIKPDIAAPGSAVYSAYNSNDRSYTTLSGTSMASPHVAGLTALLYQINPNLNVTEIRSILRGGAQPVQASGQTCGGISDSTYPNNHVGAGVISASASVRILNSMMGKE